MELKEYQNKTLDQIKRYLEALSYFKEKHEGAIRLDPELSINFPNKAWERTIGGDYISKKNGLGEDLPNFYIKIPTGGGKTLLACHTIDLINRTYLKKQTGVVLWIVPTTQIYRQTHLSLTSRDHPYRQVLDIASGGRTIIKQKTSRFTKLDVEENLVVILLMLPSASRVNKEVLKVFKDSGAFSDFFPLEDDRENNERLLTEFPNLDCYGDKNGFYGRVVKTSLGNTLRIVNPIIIIDEGHKAYSEIAQKTIRDFNPSIVVELSATPPKNSNILVNISGQELNREEMIKLDLHIINKATLEWQDVILSTIEKRNHLEKRAREYESNTGEYIRPICLIQVERTGKEQRGAKYIHAEDVREYLINQCGIPENEIAIKSSEKDDIEGIDLLSKDCQIRYIITKQALQEGWDCAFAYILTVLTNPGSQLSITQLVGRILRQPNARKTKVKELDESYVFCFRQKAKDLLENVRKGFEAEGLGDLTGRITEDGEGNAISERIVGYRDKFKRFEGKIYLPKFAIQENGGWRDVNYEMDILSRIDWKQVNLQQLKTLSLTDTRSPEQEVVVGIGEEEGQLIEERKRVVKEGGLEINKVFMTRQILDIVPNPWIAYDLCNDLIGALLSKDGEKIVSHNFIFIIEELRKLLEKEKDRLSEEIFRDLIENKVLWFFLITNSSGSKLRSRITINKNAKPLLTDEYSQIQRSLFEFVENENFNIEERSVALYLDGQEKLLWWYRNLSRQDYYIQGWRKSKIYPDFIFTQIGGKKDDYDKVFVVETKGLHLKNEDTDYKISVFELCNKYGQEKDWGQLGLEFPDKKFEFQVLFEKEWKNRINEIFFGRANEPFQ